MLSKNAPTALSTNGLPSLSLSPAKSLICVPFTFSKLKSPFKAGIASLKLNSPSPRPVKYSPASPTNAPGILTTSRAFDIPGNGELSYKASVHL